MTRPGQPFGQQHGHQFQQGYPQPPQVQAPPPFAQQTKPGNDGLRIAAAILNIAVALYIAVAAVVTVDSVIVMTNEDDDYVSVAGVVLRLAGAFSFAAAAVLLSVGAVYLFRKRRIGSTVTWISFALVFLAFLLDSGGRHGVVRGVHQQRSSPSGAQLDRPSRADPGDFAHRGPGRRIPVHRRIATTGQTHSSVELGQEGHGADRSRSGVLVRDNQSP